MAPKRKRIESGSSTKKKTAVVKGKKMTDVDPQDRPKAYMRKLEGVVKLEDVIVAERKTEVDDFRHFGLVKCFERLGWMATLLFNNNNSCRVYLKEIIEWMSTLKKEEGTNPPWTTKLIGKVNKKEVELSMSSLLRVAPFDSKPREEYVTESDGYISCEGKDLGPVWREMVTELFATPFTDFSMKMSLKAKDLKPLPRLIFKILVWNVIPRRSDKLSVRNYDVRVLYALVTGQPMIPFRQLIMMNVWDAYNNPLRTSIPHCRLLSCLLLKAGVISKKATPNIEPQIPFSKSQLGGGQFSFKETVHFFVLHDEKNDRVHRIPKETRVEGAEIEANVDAEDGVEREYEHGGRMEMARFHPERPATFQDWTPYQQNTWDRDTKMQAEQREWMRCQIYQVEKYYNNYFAFFEQVRHHEDYRAGLPYQEEYVQVDYQKLPLYDPKDNASMLPRYPQMPFPDWWPRREPARDECQGEGPSNVQSASVEPPNPFDTSSIGRSMWESLFGPRSGSH